ncbi:MAG: tyrosine-type recombinase/integrase [Bacteroidales bacterium]|nr:tyrosine-type recombinase/integrase [Bacteroidales bacterium]
MQIDEYINYIAGVRRYSQRTKDLYKDILNSYKAYFKDVEPRFTPTDIRNYEIHLLEEKKEGARTVGLHLSVLSGYCKYLMKKGELKANPVRLVSRPKEEKRLPTFYRADAMQEYFATTECNADTDSLNFLLSLPAADNTAEELYSRRLRRLIISILFNTGIRRSELISLDLGSLNRGRRTLYVHGKGDKMREIPLTESLFAEILLYLDAAEYMLGAGTGSGTPLLRTLKGTRLYPVFVDRAVKEELGSSEGFTGRKSPHVLRHTIASELLDEGTDLNSIKEMLGHSSLAATQVYTHNTIERLKKVYNNAHPRANKKGVNNGDQD